MAFSWETLVARRYIRSRRQLRFINVIMAVSVVGVTVGVAVLVVMMSVFNGFNGVVTAVLVGFDPHLRIEPASGRSLSSPAGIDSLLRVTPGIKAWAPYVSGKGLLVTSSTNRVVVVRGVVDTLLDRVSGISRSLVLGTTEFGDTPDAGGILLGVSLADRLGVTPGSELTLVSPVGADALLLQFGQPLARRCRVVGVFDSNNKDYDLHYAYVSIATARHLFDVGDRVGGIDVRLERLSDAEDIQAILGKALGGDARVQSWYDLHRDLYAVMLIERWGAFIILSLIIAVASFNILGSLAMSVHEKRRDIGILRAMGSTRGAIVRVFMAEGLLVGALGTLLGLALGLLLCWLQLEFQVFPLDTTVYIIPAIPVEIHASDLVAIVLISMVLNAAASLAPALRAARLQPTEAIRWE